MEIICSKESILKILGIAENVISTKNSISILSNILLEAKENILKISASDNALVFFGEINAEILKEGSISVYCNRFYSIIKKMPSDEIIIKVDNEYNVTILAKNNNKIEYKLKGIDAEKYPNLNQETMMDHFYVKQEIFVDMIRKTIFAIATGSNRRFVNGILFEKEDNLIKMVSSDGKRLAYIKKELDIPFIGNFSIIIPPKILNETLKICNNNGDLNIGISNKNISIKVNNLTFISNLLDANFPPYKNVIPTNYVDNFIVDRKKFFESLDRISEIGDKDINKIIISLNNKEMHIYNENVIYGSGKEILPIEINGNEIEMALNLNYILEVLNVLSGDQVVIYYKDPLNTILVKEKDNSDYIYIAMPVTV
ncbi:MAG TPA: DNA polymerase III subunit beta [Spirochaetota bacterium]|nr:DNA polymerase III subunit beta [Spirochaetota bacterium]HOL56012.1 DNA polymerase III subunit beta [Spirochaetota bacterium]HPP03454.1 DNA polymerase III subunit beta [Spirochaetota bacterium]